MPRIRTVKPEFWADEKIGDLTFEARLLFLCSLNYADDEGLIRWTPEYLKSVAFIYDDKVTARRVYELMAELQSANLVFAYTNGKTRQKLAYIVNFRKHQNINRPQVSKLPPPSVQNNLVAKMYLERDDYTCHLCGGPVPRVSQRKPLDPYGGSDPEPCDMTCVNPSLDHVVPRSKGGSDHPSNIRIAHLACNMGRCNRGVEAFSQPPSVAKALDFLTEHRPHQLHDGMDEDSSTEAVYDSSTGSLFDSLNEPLQVVIDLPVSNTDSDEISVNDSLNPSLLEGKGTGKGKKKIGAAPDGASTTALREPDGINVRAVVAAWVDAYKGNCSVSPDNGMCQQVGRDAKKLLAEGANPDIVLEAAKSCGRKGFATLRREYGPMVNRGHLRAVSGDSYRPWQGPTDQSVYDEDL